MLYDNLPYVFAAVCLLLGLFMVFMPKQSTKKELRDSEDAVKKTKRNGFVVIGCGIVLVFIAIFG